MKILVDGNFKAIRVGAFVEASGEEFVLDTENQDQKKAVLLEVAKANKVKVSDKFTVAELYEAIEAAVPELKLPAQDKPTESAQVREIVQSSHAAGKSEDETLMAIVMAGIGFKKAGKLYKQAVEALGLKVSLKDLKTRVGEILTEMAFNPKTYDELEAAIKKIEGEFPKAELGQIRGSIRRWCKINKIELPKPPEGKRGAVGFAVKVQNWIMANMNADVAAFKKWATAEKDEKVAERYAVWFEFAQKYAAAKNSESAE